MTKPGKVAGKKASVARKAVGTELRFSAEERVALRERAQELKRSRGRASAQDGEHDLQEKLAALPAPDRLLGETLHALMRAHAPHLTPRTWYGMPAWARDGEVVCFFQSGQKFKTRYATLGFSDKARLDEGLLWPTAFALRKLGPAEQARAIALILRAAG